MGIPRTIVELEKGLRYSAIDPFVSLERGGLLESAAVNAVLPLIQASGFADPMRVLRLCLQSLRVQYEEVKPQLVKCELVATLPPNIPIIARPTKQVLYEMLQRSIREIILLGYELTDQEVLRLLSEATFRGVDVIMICDREHEIVDRVQELWPSACPKPRFFQDKERRDAAPYASMHAKSLLVDGEDLLVTSANFTFHGLHGNIEIGIRLSGAAVSEARKLFSHLVETGLVEEY